MKIEVIEMDYLGNVYEENEIPHYTQYAAGNRMAAKLLFSVALTKEDEFFDPLCPVKVISVKVPKGLAGYKVRLLNNYVIKELRKTFPYVSRLPIVFLKHHGTEEWVYDEDVPRNTIFE